MSQIETPTCALRLIATGRSEACSRRRCGLWEPGGAAVDGRCLIERLGIDVRRPDLAAYLLDVRERLEQEKELSAAEAGHREFARRLGRE